VSSRSGDACCNCYARLPYRSPATSEVFRKSKVPEIVLEKFRNIGICNSPKFTEFHFSRIAETTGKGVVFCGLSHV